MSQSLRAVGVIPARAASTRFPMKVMAPLLGKPLVQYIFEEAKKAHKLQEVLIAVDHPEVESLAKSFGATTQMTDASLASGSDRVARVAASLEADLVVNLQADEPLLPAKAIDSLIELFERDPKLSMATLAVPMQDEALLQDPNTVKCVISKNHRALYFSRKPLASSVDGQFLKHIGIYAYRKEALLILAGLPPSALEKAEKLEQLRALENGFEIGVALISEDTIAVDIPSDIERVERVLKGRSGSGNLGTKK